MRHSRYWTCKANKQLKRDSDFISTNNNTFPGVSLLKHIVD